MRKLLAILIPALLTFSCQNTEELKREQYFVEGLRLYMLHCANCHQENGKGMSNLYPPLEGSGLISNKMLVPCIIRNGMKDTIIVNGKTFSRPMPGNPKLTEIEIAEITTFLNLKWGKDSTYTSIETVKQALDKCGADQGGPENL
jgi:mono/diheme cytochrome c family protein